MEIDDRLFYTPNSPNSDTFCKTKKTFIVNVGNGKNIAANMVLIPKIFISFEFKYKILKIYFQT